MEIGIVGLGRMGAGIARRLLRRSHSCVVFDASPKAGATLAEEGGEAACNLADLVGRLARPRHVWLMLPAGAPTQSVFETLLPLLAEGDLIVDGGNTDWRDDIARQAQAEPLGLSYVDVGVSGGVWGLERGYCLMAGGALAALERLAPILKDLVPDPSEPATPPGSGLVHAGPTGAGHFAKMVHNAIEYGMMQTLAEGLDILQNADRVVENGVRLQIDTPAVAQAWRRGSVIQSWLLDLAAEALRREPELQSYEGRVADSGEGRWAVEAALKAEVPADVISAALFARFRSRQSHTFAEKVLSAMREGFGGHRETPPSA